jgi:hypothetical protein
MDIKTPHIANLSSSKQNKKPGCIKHQVNVSMIVKQVYHNVWIGGFRAQHNT